MMIFRFCWPKQPKQEPIKSVASKQVRICNGIAETRTILIIEFCSKIKGRLKSQSACIVCPSDPLEIQPETELEHSWIVYLLIDCGEVLRKGLRRRRVDVEQSQAAEAADEKLWMIEEVEELGSELQADRFMQGKIFHD